MNSNYFDVTFIKVKPHAVKVFDANGNQINNSFKRIVPRIFQYSQDEFGTIFVNQNYNSLVELYFKVKIFIKDMIMNPYFFILSFFKTYRFYLDDSVNYLFPLRLVIINEKSNRNFWVSRGSISKGFLPTQIDSSLEYDRIRNPLQFSFLVRSAQTKNKFENEQLWKKTHFKMHIPKNLSYSQYSVQVLHLENSFVAHGRIAICNDTVFQLSNAREEFTNLYPSFLLQLGRQTRVLNTFKVLPTIDEAIFLGSSANLYHFIVECLSKIGGLPENQYLGLPIILEANLHQNIYDYCKLITGVEPIRVGPCEEIQVSKLLVLTEICPTKPDSSLIRSSNLKILRDLILSKLSIDHGLLKPYRKIYFKRGPNLFRPLQNELQVNLLIKSLGFELVYPEAHSLQEIHEMLSPNSLVLAESGAAITNLVLSHPNIICVEINPTGGEIGFWKEFCMVLGIQHFGINGRKFKFGLKGYASDGYFISIRKLKVLLREILARP